MARSRVRFLFSYFLLIFVLSITIGCVQNFNNQNTSDVTHAEEETLRVGISTNAPPLVYKSGGELQGVEVDFAGQLGKYLGKKVRFVELAWERQIPALEEGRIDIIMSGMTITPKRLYRIAFAKPYMRSGQMLLVRSNQSQKYSSGIYSIMGDRPETGVIENTVGDFFITKTINRPNLTRFNTSKHAVKALINKKIDVFVHDAPIICYYAAMEEKNRLTPILHLATEEYLAWAVNKTDIDLLNQVNEFIDIKQSNNELQATIKRWIPYM